MKSLSHPFIFEKAACIIDDRNPVSFLRSLKLLVYCPNSIQVVCQFYGKPYRIKIQASSSIYRSRIFTDFFYGLRHIVEKKHQNREKFRLKSGFFRRSRVIFKKNKKQTSVSEFFTYSILKQKFRSV